MRFFAMSAPRAVPDGREIRSRPYHQTPLRQTPAAARSAIDRLANMAQTPEAMSWTGFWNGAQSSYVSPRHLTRHYYTLARSIATQLAPAGVVLDFGCGEALSADLVAAQCTRLYLCESAPAVRERLSA